MRHPAPVTEGNAATVMAAIERLLGERGYPPTVRELAVATGIASTSTVDYYLERLEQAGLIERDERVSRGIRVVKNGKDGKR